MYLSRNFTVEELSKSLAAINRGLDNTPKKHHIDNLRLLCVHVLQPIRDHFALPVTINSGFRSANVNRAIGGSFTSQHMLGQAADIEIVGVHNADIWRFVQTLPAFDQVIAEHLEVKNPSAGWVHVSYAEGKNRKQGLSCTVPGQYRAGLHFKR